jgi:quinohemoprotein ethanol dehydrogenase
LFAGGHAEPHLDGVSPSDPKERGSSGGDELFTCAIVAVNADTGAYVWHYSTTPGDGWNYDATMPVVLADLPGVR